MGQWGGTVSLMMLTNSETPPTPLHPQRARRSGSGPSSLLPSGRGHGCSLDEHRRWERGAGRWDSPSQASWGALLSPGGGSSKGAPTPG